MFKVRNLRPELSESLRSLPTIPGWRPRLEAAAGAPCCAFVHAYAAETASPLHTAGTPACGSPASLRAPAGPAAAGSQTGAALPPARANARATAGPRSCAFDSDTSHDTTPSAHRRVAGSARLPPASPALPLAAPAGLPLFCDHRLQRPDVHRLFGHDVLELPVFFFQLPQPPRFAQLQPAELALPSVKTCLRDPVPTAQFSRFHPGFRLLQDGDDLVFAESTLSHDSSSGPGGPS